MGNPTNEISAHLSNEHLATHPGDHQIMSRTGQGIELMFLGIGLGDQDVFINKAIAR